MAEIRASIDTNLRKRAAKKLSDEIDNRLQDLYAYKKELGGTAVKVKIHHSRLVADVADGSNYFYVSLHHYLDGLKDALLETFLELRVKAEIESFISKVETSYNDMQELIGD